MGDDEILHSLRAEGRPAGEGRFTVDPAAAWEKARGRQLAHPYDYAVFFVRSAVAVGATRVQMYRLPHLVLERDGPAPSFRELARLPEHLLAEHVDSAGLRDLATAVNGALALPHAEVELQSWDGPEWRAIRFDGWDQAASECSDHALGRPGRGLRMKVWRRARLGGEAPALRRACRFSPIPVRVDSWAANAPLFEEPQEDLTFRLDYGQNEVRRHVAELRVIPTRVTPDCFALQQQRPGRVEYRGGELDAGRPTARQAKRIRRRRLPVTNAWLGLGIWREEECDLCLAAVARRAAPAGRATLTWLYQGVEIAHETLPLDARIRVMASAAGLRLDLGSRPIRDEAYERRLQWLMSLVGELPQSK